jgi:hypothetical protein
VHDRQTPADPRRFPCSELTAADRSATLNTGRWCRPLGRPFQPAAAGTK